MNGAERPKALTESYIILLWPPHLSRALGRDCIGLDLSAEYLRDQARPRLELDALAAWEGGDGKAGDDGHDLEDLPLFMMAGAC